MSTVARDSKPDWLEVLCAGLERLGVTVSACRSCVGEALLIVGELGDRRNPPLEVEIDRDDTEPYYKAVSGLFIRYRGSGELSRSQEHALALIARLIEKLSSKIPDDLDARFVRVRSDLPRHQALAFAYPFCTAERTMAAGGPEISEVLLRVTSRCNQACPFCSAPPPLFGGDPSRAIIERLLRELETSAPSVTVSLTGGEPTLRRDLPQLVRATLGSGRGGRSVKVQTNAVRLADDGALDGFEPSPSLSFFVSLHAVDAETYDRCTGTTGMFERALAGIENLLVRDHDVVLSVVANRLNTPGLEVWVEEVARRFSGRSRPSVHFSITLCPSHRPSAADWLVDYRDLARVLERAFERASNLGLRPEPLLSSTHAAIPACFLSPSFRARRGGGAVLEPRIDEGHGAAERPDGWVKHERCGSCLFSSTCVGVPRDYAERYGLEALRPIE